MNIFTLFNKKKAVPTQPGDMNSDTNSGKTPAQVLAEGMVNVRDIIAPSALEVDFNTLKIGNTYYRTLFVSGYPRFVGANWLSPVINFDHSLEISMFYYPVKSKLILDDLRRKITELEATIMSTKEKGRIMDPVVIAALEDANALQEQLVKGVEKYFKFSFYITIPADSEDELETVTSRLESTLGSLLLISKTASLQMEDAFTSTIPCGVDKLLITRNMDTTSLATTFPFTSSDLTMDEGIMYGVNKYNGSLIIFDRFSMENANTVVFAKSGAGKSYFVKLEALRLMVFGAEVMIIDPEEEYRPLCETVGGNYIDFSASSPSRVNPFDLSGVAVEGENELGVKLLSLMTLLKLMLGGMTPTEEAVMDRSLIETYRIKGITTDPDTQITREPPVMEDLYKVLLGGDEPESRDMANRLERFIKGSMAGIFDSQSNIDLNSKMTCFSTKNLEDTLRPLAFYIILDFVWTKIRKDLRKRVLIVEEAWYLMQNADSAKFIYGIAKRARKYYLGLTTISQDVDDFLKSEYGGAIVSNSSIQILFKQHPSAIDKVAETFYLSEGEKRLLLAAGVGEGLFFAGSNHVAIRVIASEAEHRLITTNPEEILRLKEEGLIKPKQASKSAYQQTRPLDPSKYTTMDKEGMVKPEYTVEGIKSGTSSVNLDQIKDKSEVTASVLQPLINKPTPAPQPQQNQNPVGNASIQQPKPPVQSPQPTPVSPAAVPPQSPKPTFSSFNPFGGQNNKPSTPPASGQPPVQNQNNQQTSQTTQVTSPKVPEDKQPTAEDILRSVQDEIGQLRPNPQLNPKNDNDLV